MSKEFLVGWPALVRAGLGSEWERSRSRSDTIIDPSRRSLTTQTFPDTEPAPEPEPVSKVGARDSPPTTQLRSGPESKQRPVSGYQWGWPSGGQWRDTGCGQHWGRWDISDPGAVTSAGSLQCPHHCSSWSLGLAPCRAHWPVIFRSRQRSTKQEKHSLRLSRHWCFAQWVKIQFWMFSPSILCRLCSLWKFVCMLFEYSYLKEKKFGNKVMEPLFFWHFVFILKWSRGQMSPGARSCNAASVRPGRRCITCNAVYHHAASGQYHDCLFSPCTQKYRLRIRVKLIFSISEEAGDLVTRDAASWPPPVPHVSQDGVLRVCQGNFTVGDRFAK